MTIACIILAGGNSSRYQQNQNKNNSKLLEVLANNQTVLKTSYNALAQTATLFSKIVIVTHPSWQETYQAEFSDLEIMPDFITGGETRRASVFNALTYFSAEPPEAVLIHDAARPLVQKEAINELIYAFQSQQLAGASLAHRVTDTIKRTLPNTTEVSETIARSDLWAIETPQIFNFKLLYAAHQQTPQSAEITDDLMLLEKNKMGPLFLVENSACNLKITTPQDLLSANSMLSKIVASCTTH